jgi:hypothetical protein
MKEGFTLTPPPQKKLDTFNKQPGLSAPEDSHNLKIINKNL